MALVWTEFVALPIGLARRLSEQTVGALEIGRDDVTCVDVLREGHVSKRGSQSEIDGTLSASRSTSGDPCANEDFQWLDPINLKLTEITTYGCFAYTGTYVGNCTTSAPTVWWNVPSGWHNLGPGDNTVTYNSDDTQCYANTTNNFVHYAGTGCWTGTTNVYYQPNRLVMYGWGGVGQSTNTWATGACVNQLHTKTSL
jgi:hypothetical protein